MESVKKNIKERVATTPVMSGSGKGKVLPIIRFDSVESNTISSGPPSPSSDFNTASEHSSVSSSQSSFESSSPATSGSASESSD